jgi:hypothetical protein
MEPLDYFNENIKKLQGKLTRRGSPTDNTDIYYGGSSWCTLQGMRQPFAVLAAP